MIIPDINLLIYAYNQDDIRYEDARTWWDNLLESEDNIGIPLAVSVGFVRLATNPNVMSPPMTSTHAGLARKKLVTKVQRNFVGCRFPNTSTISRAA